MTTTIETNTKPFQWGDRVDHKLFGLGIVNGDPVAVCGPAPRTHEIVSKGWRVPVKWDDPSRTATSVACFVLRLVTRPDAKGGAFWNHEYKKLLERVLKARATSESAMKEGFRPHDGGGTERVSRALKQEQEAVAELQEFLKADEAGDHV
ncbi:MAG: hypothetical protein AAFR39_07995 [Pseudomonadota bacterium]